MPSRSKKWDGRSSTLQNEQHLGREEYARRKDPNIQQLPLEEEAKQIFDQIKQAFVGDLDQDVPNHFDQNKRGFDPR